MKLPNYLSILAAILLAVLSIFVGLKSWNAYAEHFRIGVAVQDRDTIAVSGMGKVTATPDLALVNLGVQTETDSVRTGQEENTNKMNAIIKMLKENNIDEKDITTNQYSVYPRYNWEDGEQEVIGYTVSQSVAVKVRDLDKVGDLVAQAGDLGANQVGGIQFTIDEPELLQDEARDKAIQDAREKAEVLADQLGIRLVKIVSFSEGGYGGAPIPYAAYDRAESLAVGIGGAGPAPDIQEGTQEVVSNVNVIFEVY